MTHLDRGSFCAKDSKRTGPDGAERKKYDTRYNIRRNKKAEKIVILTHELPDGDAVGVL